MGYDADFVGKVSFYQPENIPKNLILKKTANLIVLMTSSSLFWFLSLHIDDLMSAVE